MKILRCVILMLIKELIFPILGMSQTPTASFSSLDDSTARVYRKNYNGGRCAIIKVNIDYEGKVLFDSKDIVQQTQIREGEYILAVRPKIEELSIIVENVLPSIHYNIQDQYKYGLRDGKAYLLSIEGLTPKESKSPTLNNSSEIAANSIQADKKSYRIVEFKELHTDISARTNQVLDPDGVPCGLVKVRIPLSNVEFLNAVKVVAKPGEYWVYLRDEVFELIMATSVEEYVTINLSDYDLEPIVSKQTYQMVVEPPFSAYLDYVENVVFDDDESDDEKEQLLFGESYIADVKSFAAIMETLYAYDREYGFYFLSPERSNIILKASGSGWPDATRVLIDLLEGSPIPGNKTNYTCEELKQTYKDACPQLTALYDRGTKYIDELKSLLIDQERVLEEELVNNQRPNISNEEYSTSGPVSATSLAMSELRKMVDDYNTVTQLAYTCNHIPNFSGNVFNYHYHGYCDGIEILVPGSTGVYQRKFVSELCVKYIDRMREHRWKKLLEFYNKWKRCYE